jgi:probable O-glycosylation ligase (exosortase A-associated)
LQTKQQVIAFMWVCALSLGLLGAKGGVFTIATGGAYRVWGPHGSFIGDNNAFALALIMTIPLLRFLQMQLAKGWARHAMTVMMILVAAAALGSHSRGALLAIVAMSTVLWWRGRSKVMAGCVIVFVAVALLSFMPENWLERMDTIQDYDEDRSALGRFAAWGVAWNLAFQHPFGVGFNAARPELFLQYSPYGLEFGTPAAHSIYFQVLGHHGFVGLSLFLGIWIFTMWMAGRIRKESRGIPQAQWCFDLASMCQVALVGYAVGGAFLSLSYFDLPYNLMVAVSVTLVWLRTRGWEREEQLQLKWFRVPGVNWRSAEVG